MCVCNAGAGSALSTCDTSACLSRAAQRVQAACGSIASAPSACMAFAACQPASVTWTDALQVLMEAGYGEAALQVLAACGAGKDVWQCICGRIGQPARSMVALSLLLCQQGVFLSGPVSIADVQVQILEWYDQQDGSTDAGAQLVLDDVQVWLTAVGLEDSSQPAE